MISDRGNLPILSSIENLKYLTNEISVNDLVNLLSDIKHRVFPRPFERLSSLSNRANLVGAEIGVAGGEHALSLLKNLEIKKLYLIDPYELYETYSEGKSHYKIDQRDLTSTEEHAKELLKEYSNQIVWIKKLSSDAVSDILEKLDFVYIDGNHQANFVNDDITNYSALLRSEGVIGGHDYYNGYQREHDAVVKVVSSFIASTGKQLRVELPDWWVEGKD